MSDVAAYVCASCWMHRRATSTSSLTVFLTRMWMMKVWEKPVAPGVLIWLGIYAPLNSEILSQPKADFVWGCNFRFAPTNLEFQTFLTAGLHWVLWSYLRNARVHCGFSSREWCAHSNLAVAIRWFGLLTMQRSPVSGFEVNAHWIWGEFPIPMWQTWADLESNKPEDMEPIKSLVWMKNMKHTPRRLIGGKIKRSCCLPPGSRIDRKEKQRLEFHNEVYQLV